MSTPQPIPTGHMDAHLTQTQFDAVLALTIHDIKNSLVMLLDNLEDKAEQLGKNDTATAIFKYEVRRINNNLVRLLSLYRVGAAKYTPQIDDVPIADFIEEIALEYQALLSAKGIEISTESEGNLLGQLDKGLIFSVIENALNNASRYCKGQVKISARSTNGFVEIEVSDDGDGYPSSMLEQSNEIQSQTSIDSSSGTTGLGIYFSLIAARLHDHEEKQGYIIMENGGELGGSCFRIGLPLLF